MPRPDDWSELAALVRRCGMVAQATLGPVDRDSVTGLATLTAEVLRVAVALELMPPTKPVEG